MTLAQRLAAEIHAARKSAGLTQEDLAEKARVHRTYISQLERGLKSPTVDVLARIASALGTTPASLLTGAEKVPT